MEINEYLVKLFQAIKDMESLDLFAGATKLSRTEFRLLREIIMEKEKGKEIISSELARRLGVTRSAISQTVTKMEGQGVVKRAPAPDDKKIAYVQLSEYAIGEFETQCRSANELMERVEAELGTKKLDSLFKAYDEFILALRRARKEMEKEQETVEQER